MPSPEEKNMNMSENERSRQEPRKGKPERRKAGGDPPEELSPAWRELLGLGDTGTSRDKSQPGRGQKAGHELEPDATIPTVAGDPWVDLVHEQDVEEVDLQRTRLREQQKGQASTEDSDVKQALDLMQEESDPGGKA